MNTWLHENIHVRQMEVVEYLIKELKEFDSRVILYLKGSLARGTSDEHSDVDFYCYIPKEGYEDLKAFRESLLGSYRPILYKEYVNFGLEQMIILYDDNIHLDFYITDEIPDEGTDALLALHDPESRLSQYKQIAKDMDMKQVIKYINGSIYTLQEIDTAFKRKDDFWSLRLLSHITAYISQVLCYYFEPNKPVLHMKGVYHHLPEPYKSMINDLINTSQPEKKELCLVHTVNMLDVIINLCDEESKKDIQRGYLEFIKREYDLL